MAIYSGTRYEESEIISITQEGENPKTFVYAGERENIEEKGNKFERHEQIEGQYIDLIAAIHADNPLLYYKICDINNILDPFEIEKGRKLFIPSLDEF